MAFLIDTHALIWWWLDDPSLSDPARQTIADNPERLFVSPISAFEIALKVRRGSLPAMGELLGVFDEAARGDGMRHLPLGYDHARWAGLMSGSHRDPFDRLLAAQALVEGFTVITRDKAFDTFGCKVLW